MVAVLLHHHTTGLCTLLGALEPDHLFQMIPEPEGMGGTTASTHGPIPEGKAGSPEWSGQLVHPFPPSPSFFHAYQTSKATCST